MSTPLFNGYSYTVKSADEPEAAAVVEEELPRLPVTQRTGHCPNCGKTLKQLKGIHKMVVQL